MDHWKSISVAVVIATCDRNNDLFRLLKCLPEVLRCWKSIRVMIIDAGSEESFQANARLIAELDFEIVHVASEKHKSRQLNKALSDVSEDYILILDDDVILNKNYLNSIILCFDNSNVVGATGYVVNQKRYNTFEALFRKIFLLQDVNGKLTTRKTSGYFSFKDKPSGISQTITLWGCNMMIKGSALDTCRFDERLTNFVDLDFSLCLGKKGILRISEEAKLVHNRSRFNRDSAWIVIVKQMISNFRMLRKQMKNPIVLGAFLWSAIGSMLLVLVSVLLSVDLTKGTFDSTSNCPENHSECIFNHNELR